MDDDLQHVLEAVNHLQQARFGDSGRLAYVRHAIESGSKVYRSDWQYVLKKHAQLKALHQKEKDQTKTHVTTRPEHRCSICATVLNLEDRVVRYENGWLHAGCFAQMTDADPAPSGSERKHITILPTAAAEQIPAKTAHKRHADTCKSVQSAASRPKKAARADPVLVLLAVVIFSLLIFTAYSLFSYLSIIAISLAAVLVLFQIATRAHPQDKYRYGRRGASLFSMAVMIMPFALGTIIAYDGFAHGLLSLMQTVFIWGLTLSFWQTMLFVPLAIRSISREEQIGEPNEYPKMSILVPAYNEERVIRTTIESLLATDYPDKEIIAIDDGSKDGTLTIMSEYKDRIKVIHKENGGKASALNAGLLYSTGQIIVILDADTIIGYSALRHIARSFNTDNVAAVAGNVKVRNRINTITRCQALEYLSGIQIMRRGLDYFGAITIVPGALGAFKKSKLEEAGAYHKETLVEDFDATMKVLRSGMIVSGSNRATAYTQAPNTLSDFYKQRKRWYRGNLQVLRRHSDILLNPRFGYLQKFAYPLMAIHMLLIPSASLLVMAFAAYQVLIGNYLYIVYTLGLYITLQHLLSAMAVRMDRDDKKLILYSTLMVVGYKQLTDILQLKAVIEELLRLKAKWTSAKRVRE